jgi:predicted ATP-dependent protease
MTLNSYEIAAEKLSLNCDPGQFNFKCTKELAPLKEFIGQERAIRGIEFGLAMKNPGYNIYVSGLSGTGKTSIVKTYINRMIQKRTTNGSFHSQDWCYVFNFTETDKPRILKLPKGRGKTFKEQLLTLQQNLKDGLAKAFSSEEYKNQVKNTVQAGQAEQQKLFLDISSEARQKGLFLQITPSGPVLVPLAEGKPMTEEAFLSLAELPRQEIESRRALILEKLQDIFEKARNSERLTVEKIKNSDQAVADFTVSRLFTDLTQDYANHSEVLQFLGELKTHTLSNLDLFKEKTAEPTPAAVMTIGAAPQLTMRVDPFLPFQVNVFVDNSATHGPPIITETNPNYLNLFGKIERHFLLGGYLSDHTMLKSGALQRANDGYLILSAQDILANPAVWPTLKRALKDREARVEEPYEQLGLFVPVDLRPQPMPLNVKIVLIGDPQLYQLLSAYDEDFFEIFRVKAEFDYEVERTPANMLGIAAFICGCCEDCEIKHFDPSGVAKVIDYTTRLVANQNKLSTRFAQIKEIVEEAGYWAQKDTRKYVSAEHVEKAVEERRYLHNLPDQKLREMIAQGTIMIDTRGAVSGQVNGLSVYSLGDISFGKPCRITCRTYLGRAGIINIERESQMSRKIHDKGVLILNGYLGWKYAQEFPLSLSASLCFEQSYDGVEGDSASSTELYCLLSSLADAPIRQSIAVTGSVNQKGEIQPIGGINQKIEGFFEVCQAAGLNGEQGVLMPARNLNDLVLRENVVEAVKKGLFHFWAVNSVDEGLEILTGIPAGVRNKSGRYPVNSINFRVENKLKRMAERLISIGKESKEEGAKPGKSS